MFTIILEREKVCLLSFFAFHFLVYYSLAVYFVTNMTKSLVTEWYLGICGPIIEICGTLDHSVTGIFVHYSGHHLVTRL